MKTSTIIFVTLATGFVSSLAALYVGYLVAQRQLSDATAKNPFLNFFSKL